jgi:DNA (cytosine-5)-methyltransferase 1
MQKLKTIDLFAGIGGIRLGFEAWGCENVFTSEWDKDAQTMKLILDSQKILR